MKNKILAMEAGSTLDSLIAEDVMKWYISEGEYSGKKYWNDENDHSPYSVKDFKPSSDISAAWKVVEKFNIVHLEYVEWFEGAKSYHAKIYCADEKMYEAIASTAPEAICKAALLAVMDL